MPNIMLIGPQGSGTSAANVIGGNKLMTDDLARELSMRGFDLSLVDTSGRVTNLPSWKIRAIRLTRFLRVAWRAAKQLRRCDLIFLVIAPYSALGLASFFWAVCKIARRPLVVRLTGSGLMEQYLKYGAFARWLADRTYMRTSLVYVETQQLRRDFNEPANFRWFPNTRDIESPKASKRGEVNKLIFLARLEMSKGLAEALDACRHLPENCHLNVFGPAVSDTDFSLFEGHQRATYGGVLKPEETPRVLSEHDLMLFPSYCRAEGYPGSILEAFQCGLPVVAAKWGGVPELVEHEKSGLLVEPRSAAAVRCAIERLLEDPEMYRLLCAGARRRGEYFRSANWYGRVAADLHNLCRQRAPHGASGQTAK